MESVFTISAINIINVYIYVVPLSANAPTVLYNSFETSVCAYVMTSRYGYAFEKFLSLVSIFCSTNLGCFMIVHIFKDKHKVAGT